MMLETAHVVIDLMKTFPKLTMKQTKSSFIHDQVIMPANGRQNETAWCFLERFHKNEAVTRTCFCSAVPLFSFCWSPALTYALFLVSCLNSDIPEPTSEDIRNLTVRPQLWLQPPAFHANPLFASAPQRRSPPPTHPHVFLHLPKS